MKNAKGRRETGRYKGSKEGIKACKKYLRLQPSQQSFVDLQKLLHRPLVHFPWKSRKKIAVTIVITPGKATLR